ncbi:MAG: DUF1835 domain-containing protein [Candidatus Thiodiazotropha sp.]
MIENLAALRAQISADTPDFFSHFDADDPRRLKPLSLEQQKKRAKELLRDWKASPGDEHADKRLSDAQIAVARSHGFRSWPQLKVHIERNRIARDALGKGEPEAPDGQARVLHIRCGTDIRHALAIAGFRGDFLAFFDPLAHGPVADTDDLETYLRMRADHITQHRHPQAEQVADDLRQQYAALEQAHTYDAVHLWFEHDPFDQLILARLLDYFSQEDQRPARLELISVSHYPGVERFNGIGQLPAEAMRVLWSDFRPVSAEQFALGRQVWSALRAPTPDALRRIIASGTPELPTMAIALERHLQLLPSQRNGLNLCENLTLEILRDKGDMNAARLFGWYTNHYEPLVFMGDTYFWRLLEGLAQAEHPAIVLDKQGEPPNQWQVRLSDTGHRLLQDQVDWIALNGIDRWVGGIHLDSRSERIWRAPSPLQP